MKKPITALASSGNSALLKKKRIIAFKKLRRRFRLKCGTGEPRRAQAYLPAFCVDRFAAAERRRLLRQKAIEFLGGKCQICEYDVCPDALDFHHTNPMEKDFVISARMTSWMAIEAELRKCVLVCCRCHREIHAGYRNGYLVHPDDDRSGY